MATVLAPKARAATGYKAGGGLRGLLKQANQAPVFTPWHSDDADDDGSDGSGDGGDGPIKSPRRPKLKLRTVWISDVHLGTTGCKAELLLDFLKSIECDTLYLVGDIIDGWRLKRSWYWNEAHNDVVRRVLKLARKGVRVVYIPGNHDEALRPYVGLNLGGVELMETAVHTTADGRKLWVLHGDMFDSVVLYARWLAFLGDKAYVLLLKLNTGFNLIRRTFGLPYWSLSAFLKKKVKNAVDYISRFEEAVAQAAKDAGLDGVVCGHIHSAEIRTFHGIQYFNDGDWVESCTALVEAPDGSMRLIDWAEEVRQRNAVHAARSATAQVAA
jgi:UDP-2,3-diacylglucosamine pyrophosphatase LpxH